MGPEWKIAQNNIKNHTKGHNNRLYHPQNPNEDLEEDQYSYSNLKRLKQDSVKYNQNRVSRSTVINTNTKGTAVSTNFDPLTKNYLEVQTRGEYRQNPQNFTKNKKTARDFSTGMERMANDYSLTASKDNLHDKKG